MHSEVQKDTPGICPECGMNLIQQKYESRSMNHEYDKHAGHSTAAFLKKFWINLALTIPVVAYSDIVQKVFNWSPPAFYGSAYIPLIFGSIVFFYGGWVFILGAYKEIRAKLPGMMTLIALAISAAYLYSVYVELSGPAFVEATAGKHPLFWELTTLITVMLLGHWIEMKAVSGAQSALRELSKLLPDTAEIIVNHESGITNHSNTKTISLSELKIGDIVFVRPGGRIPADGVVVDGKSDVDESMVTGESKPVAKTEKGEVIAGTINGDGALKIRVTKIGEHTFLAGVMRLVAEAQASKSRLQILSDRAAFYLTIIAIAAGSLTFVLWIVAQAGFSFAVERLVAVLVIACPHALGLAVPLVASISTTMAARNGFLVRQRLALEAARKIDIVLFDKTGTLTKGEYGVQKIWSVGEETENGILELAASVDAHSEHFISRAIVSDANKKGLPLFEVKDFQRIPGKGVRGIVDSKEVMAGGLQILEDNKITPSETLAKEISEENKKGKTIIFVLKDKKLIGAIALADIIREESREALSELKTMGVKTAMITGDSEDVAKWVADELGIDECFARVLPGEKSEKVKILQQKGLKVSMVGDGINDAPALTQADLGIAIGAGTNVAIESAGIILVRNDPRDIVKIIKLSQATYSKMIQNLFWATGYNVIALPLAAGVLASRGIILQPALAALFMSLSTVIVAVNAVLLRRKVL
ncbi:ATPase P [Candidatus Azambacteria bacterium RIFCSPHIGHO2_01_FULL_44_55]|uniref:ATPase P n=1 Tax=Candidatus Azambacteria bacterium RIFCSPLOWO2_02_FULL_44_14 TaxID=1797306 RepID=A0A1F5CAV5_9BACT|nr:MAG: ATPase P [Candidatus Azambacteria bacterium RIFCSPLOWO2_01_FULL_44_84]OGD33488.1 MAG: ATPase P [Candidatus Azambacteria bacterium RIFCSPHIGHO2_02_FULL_45_18]OGD39696.1 MAG: ATPase P [Candidatus Azambacteria bacterium RIFCSPHIGHO2_01_FULL_44_55]OGD39973.1 MAG: ATPase P [Candidatus Azambacteria bacterium RIFCSPLOWO2_02_FULL_44_14]